MFAWLVRPDIERTLNGIIAQPFPAGVEKGRLVLESITGYKTGIILDVDPSGFCMLHGKDNAVDELMLLI
jgi:hypothetical protein